MFKKLPSPGFLHSTDPVILAGLIRLPSPAVLNPGVQLTCLPLSPPAVSQAIPGTTATIVGWGHTNLRDQAKTTLIGQDQQRYCALIGQDQQR